MASHLKSIEELIRELPLSERESVRDFVEFLLARQETGAASSAARTSGDVREFFGTWDSGDEHSANNERIEADLAREYANTHEVES
jgi:hypothetical protein